MKQFYKDFLKTLEEQYEKLKGEAPADLSQSHIGKEVIEIFSDMIRDLKEIDEKTNDDYELSKKEMIMLRAGFFNLSARLNALRDGIVEGGASAMPLIMDTNNSLDSSLNEFVKRAEELGLKLQVDPLAEEVWIDSDDEASETIVFHLKDKHFTVETSETAQASETVDAPKTGKESEVVDAPETAEAPEAGVAEKTAPPIPNSKEIAASMAAEHQILMDQRAKVPTRLLPQYDAYTNDYKGLLDLMNTLAEKGSDDVWTAEDRQKVVDQFTKTAHHYEILRTDLSASISYMVGTYTPPDILDAVEKSTHATDPIHSRYDACIEKEANGEPNFSAAWEKSRAEKSFEPVPGIRTFRAACQTAKSADLPEISQAFREQTRALHDLRRDVPASLLPDYDRFLLQYQDLGHQIDHMSKFPVDDKTLLDFHAPCETVAFSLRRLAGMVPSFGIFAKETIERLDGSLDPFSMLLSYHDRVTKEKGLPYSSLLDSVEKRAEDLYNEELSTLAAQPVSPAETKAPISATQDSATQDPATQDSATQDSATQDSATQDSATPLSTVPANATAAALGLDQVVIVPASEASIEAQKAEEAAVTLHTSQIRDSLDAQIQILTEGRQAVPEAFLERYDAYTAQYKDLANLMTELADKDPDYRWTNDDMQQIIERSAVLAHSSRDLEEAVEDPKSEAEEALRKVLDDSEAPIKDLGKDYDALAHAKRLFEFDSALEAEIENRFPQPKEASAQADDEATVFGEEAPEKEESSHFYNRMFTYGTGLISLRKDVPIALGPDYGEYVFAYQELQHALDEIGTGPWKKEDLDTIGDLYSEVVFRSSMFNDAVTMSGASNPKVAALISDSKSPLRELVFRYDQHIAELDPSRKPLDVQASERMPELREKEYAEIKKQLDKFLADNPSWQNQFTMQQGPVPAPQTGAQPQAAPVQAPASPDALQGQTVSQQAAPQLSPFAGIQFDAVPYMPGMPPQPQPKPEPPNIKEMRASSLEAKQNLSLAMPEGSEAGKDYLYAYNAFDLVSKEWVSLDDNKVTGEDLTETDIRRLRKKVLEARVGIEVYLEQAEKNGTAPDEKEKQRIQAMKDALKQLSEQDERLETHQTTLEMAPAPTYDAIALRSETVLLDMEDAKALLHQGSREFDAAMTAFSELNDRLQEIRSKGAGYQPTAEDLHDLREFAGRYNDAADLFLLTENRKETKGRAPECAEAILAGKDAVRAQEKRLKQTQTALEARSVKTIVQLTAQNGDCLDDLRKANTGVHFGSDEYKKAMELFEMNNSLLVSVNLRRTTGITATQREQLDRQRIETLRAVDRYLASKVGQELDDKTIKRVTAMRQARENLIEQGAMIEQERVRMRQSARHSNPKELDLENRSISNRLHTADQHVRKGSQQYTDARNSFNRTGDLLAEYYHNPNPDEASTQTALTELRRTQEKIGAYLDYKGIGELDAKGDTRRFHMRAAYDHITLQIDRIEGLLEAREAGEIISYDGELKNGVETYQKKMKESTGKGRLMAAAAYEASRDLASLAGKASLSDAEKLKALYGFAALVLQEKFDKTPGDAFQANFPAKADDIALNIKIFAESPEFKRAFPISSLTPEKCRGMVTDHMQVKQGLQAFTNATRAARAKTQEHVADMKRALAQDARRK